MNAPSGWHPAPDRPGWLRFWDGYVWTDHYAPPPPQAPQATATQQQPVAAAQPKGLRCPHCGAVGRVKTRKVKQKVGVSGAKATGAVLTAGFSVLATGLSRKQNVTEMKCRACKTVWHVA